MSVATQEISELEGQLRRAQTEARDAKEALSTAQTRLVGLSLSAKICLFQCSPFISCHCCSYVSM